jgi:tetratricopeptide (TPR) repeat protein
MPPPTPATPLPLTTPRWETRLVALLEAMTETELGRDFDVVVQKVESFGGRVEEAGTSRVVAAFGLDPAEDAPRRAALAAMAIRNAQAAYPSPARRAPMTIAVHAEPCPVGYVSGRTEVDGAARRRMMARLDELCARGEPEVLVSYAARSLLDPHFDFEEPDARTDPSGRASRVLGYAPHRFGLGAQSGPFVGREHELGVLRGRWQEAREGRGQIVALVGEPGIGKSRLLFELRRTLGDEPLTYLEGRGESYGGGIPYLPVIDFLRGFFHIEEQADPAATAEKVRVRLLALEPALAPDVSPFLALLHAPGTDPHWSALEPAQRRQRTLDALRHFVLRLSQIQPVLLAIEDLHWIDAETQAFLDRLIVSLPAIRLLVIVSYRPEYRPTVGSQVSYTQLHLDPLAQASAAALVRALVGDHAALQPLARMLIERTEGNPFFLEESVRTLVETRALVGERGAYRPTSELHALAVPPTVRAVLGARIDRLAPEDKHVIQAAAVIGKDVPFGLLLAIAAVSEATLRRALTDLQAAGFLREVCLFPDVEYTFKHALTQEVAYDGLLPERRQALHTGVVEALERAYADRLADQVEWLAHHARAAELWDKALAYCRQAGAKAAWRSAHREAVQDFEQALAAIRQVPETPATRAQTLDLYLQLRWSLVPLGDYHRLAESLRNAAALAEGLNDPLRLGEISQSMTNYLRLAGDCDGALEAGRRAHAIGADLESHTLQVRARYQLGLVYRQRGEYSRAIEALASVVDALRGELLYERFGEPSVLSVHARAWLALTLADVGRFSDGLALAEEAVQIASDSRNAFSQTTAHHSLGGVHARRGDLDRALPPLERSVALCRDGNFRLLLPPTASALGAALTQAERVEEALPLLELAVEVAVGQGLIGGSSLYQVRLGHALLLAKRGVEARELAHRALDAARKHKERGHEAWALHLLGDVAALGEPADSLAAARHYAEALALAQALGMQPLVVQCQNRLGTGVH